MTDKEKTIEWLSSLGFSYSVTYDGKYVFTGNPCGYPSEYFLGSNVVDGYLDIGFDSEGKLVRMEAGK